MGLSCKCSLRPIHRWISFTDTKTLQIAMDLSTFWGSSKGKNMDMSTWDKGFYENQRNITRNWMVSIRPDQELGVRGKNPIFRPMKKCHPVVLGTSKERETHPIKECSQNTSWSSLWCILFMSQIKNLAQCVENVKMVPSQIKLGPVQYICQVFPGLFDLLGDISNRL